MLLIVADHHTEQIEVSVLTGLHDFLVRGLVFLCLCHNSALSSAYLSGRLFKAVPVRFQISFSNGFFCSLSL